MTDILVQENEREVTRTIMKSEFSDDINSLWIENTSIGRTLFIELNTINNIDNIQRFAEASISENNSDITVTFWCNI